MQGRGGRHPARGARGAAPTWPDRYQAASGHADPRSSRASSPPPAASAAAAAAATAAAAAAASPSGAKSSGPPIPASLRARYPRPPPASPAAAAAGAGGCAAAPAAPAASPAPAAAALVGAGRRREKRPSPGQPPRPVSASRRSWCSSNSCLREVWSTGRRLFERKQKAPCCRTPVHVCQGLARASQRGAHAWAGCICLPASKHNSQQAPTRDPGLTSARAPVCQQLRLPLRRRRHVRHCGRVLESAGRRQPLAQPPRDLQFRRERII